MFKTILNIHYTTVCFILPLCKLGALWLSQIDDDDCHHKRPYFETRLGQDATRISNNSAQNVPEDKMTAMLPFVFF